MFLENRLSTEPKVYPAPEDIGEWGQPSAYANRFAVRHLGFGNLAFADGHVDKKRGFQVVTNGLAYFPQSEIIWTADPRVNPNIF
jgi:prepilin-type processing-associated H-X9-DG protein